MKRLIINLLVSFMVAFTLLYINQKGCIPWDKIIKPVYEIPDLKGLARKDAETVCRIKNLKLSVADEIFSDKYAEGEIMSQMPLAFSKAADPEVNIILCKGTPLIKVPELKGLTLDEAALILKKSKLSVGQPSYINSDIEEGKIVASSPVSGAEVGSDFPVNVVVSKGAVMVSVPNLAGQTLDAAKNILLKAGLKMGTVKKQTDVEKRFGILIKQWPESGKKVKPGASITVIINEETED